MLYILVGPPGCGKNTWVQGEIKKSKTKSIALNRDDLRSMIAGGNLWNYKFNAEAETYITEIQRNSAEYAIKMNWNVYIADTNLNPRTYDFWVQFAKYKNVEYKVVNFYEMFIEDNSKLLEEKGSLAVLDAFRKRCKEWNLKRLYSVPENVIDNMIDTYIKPKYCTIKKYTGTPGKPKAILVDLDGTLFHMGDKRKPFDWDKVHLDEVDPIVKETVQLYKNNGYYIIAVSGRDGICEAGSIASLNSAGIPYDSFFMRAIGDQRTDRIVKEEIFWSKISANWDVKLALDDRDQVVAHYREMGIKVYQVNPGNF